jgi:predicted hydrocarbon binding protein
MALIAGLLEILEEANGVEVTEDMMYMNGKRRGEHVGKKLGAGKDPETALEEFIDYIKPYYEIDIKHQNATKKGYIADLQFKKCMVKDLCKDRGLSIKNPLCRNSYGFIEGALSFMTGMQVDIDIPLVGWDICQGTVEFKQKRDRFNFL